MPSHIMNLPDQRLNATQRKREPAAFKSHIRHVDTSSVDGLDAHARPLGPGAAHRAAGRTVRPYRQIVSSTLTPGLTIGRRA